MCRGLLVVFALLAGSCTNPFAPGTADGNVLDDILGDPTTLDGFYTRFQNAYQLRDSSLYGPLIDPAFRFTYRDPELNTDISWGRTEELYSTTRLFESARDIQLQWNQVIERFENGDRTQAQVFRRFNLYVVLNDASSYRTDGATNFILTRADSTAPWRLVAWRDESEI